MARPLTELTGVVVTHDQTGAVWRTRKASIVDGRIRIPASRAPEGFFAAATATFTINARDGAGRSRTFAHVVVDRERTAAGAVVFR